jgi:transcription elongation GreA/GreB family factor
LGVKRTWIKRLAIYARAVLGGRVGDTVEVNGGGATIMEIK